MTIALALFKINPATFVSQADHVSWSRYPDEEYISSDDYIYKNLDPLKQDLRSLAEELIQKDALVVQVSGNAVVHNRQLLDNRWDKHDLRDTADIADLISAGECMFYDYQMHSIHDLRELLSLRCRFASCLQ